MFSIGFRYFGMATEHFSVGQFCVGSVAEDLVRVSFMFGLVAAQLVWGVFIVVVVVLHFNVDAVAVRLVRVFTVCVGCHEVSLCIVCVGWLGCN